MYSNCLFETLKAKLKEPKAVHIKMLPGKFRNNIFPHFYWIKDNYAYDFRSEKKRRKYQVILFKGTIHKCRRDIYENFNRALVRKYLEKRYRLILKTDYERDLEWKNIKQEKPDLKNVFDDSKISIAFIENNEPQIKIIPVEDFSKYKVCYWKWEEALIENLEEFKE